MRFSARTIGIGIAAVALATAAVLYQNSGCTTIGSLTPSMGSQGYRVWSGPSLKTFTHTGQSVCVPEGWLAVAPVSTGDGTARFERGKTGVLIKKDAFGLRTIRPEDTKYAVTILYPLSLSRQDVQKITTDVDHAFSAVGAWYGDTATTTRTTHTLLVTTGLSEGEPVYPDPSARLTLYIRSPDSERAEGLMIHAVVHLYNRYAGEPAYLALQEPFNVSEFQELEATWAETAFSTHPDAAFTRLNYLYRVHSALVADRPDLVTEPPFNDESAFRSITPTIFVQPGSPGIDYQYGHYVLAPLTMAALDALLVERGTGLRLYDIMRDIHRNRRTNLVGTLKEVLAAKDVKQVMSWATADAQIPAPLIEKAIRMYDR